MKFYEIINAMGYEQVSKEGKHIVIERKRKFTKLTIIIDSEFKYIRGFMFPLTMIAKQYEMDAMNNDWDLLKIDMLTLQDLSGYQII